MSRRLALALTFVMALAPMVLADQGNSQGRGRSGGTSGGSSGGNAGGNDKGTDINVSLNIFTDNDRATFRDYFRTHKISAQALPPGIAKNVARGKPLPPGIAKRALPNDLVRGLGSRAGKDIIFSIVGDRVVAVRSGNVIDVLLNVF